MAKPSNHHSRDADSADGSGLDRRCNQPFLDVSIKGLEQSLNGIFNGVVTTCFFLIWHAFEGIAIFALSLILLAFSIKAKPKSIRICAILGLVYVVVAGVGGLLFVLSGFTNNGNSAQMGGSFIGAYAFYFMELYYAK